ncbi:MAG TPA: RidA family protein [Oligoflexia bacterium]|nr:RidA family protein [Oligoflexia bacterium]HMP47149.1 RidA family protein [Oligoflexia bacterium]
MKQINNAPSAPSPVGSYSQAIQSGNMLYCSGQIAIKPVTSLLETGGIEAETRQVLENISAILEHAGSSIDKIVMTTIFLLSMDDFSLVNKVYSEYVSKECPPARQTVAVRELPLGAKVEISVIVECS